MPVETVPAVAGGDRTGSGSLSQVVIYAWSTAGEQKWV